MALLPLVGPDYPHYAFIDAEDLALVEGRRWRAEKREQTYYVRCVSRCGHEGEYLHRVVMGTPPPAHRSVDHLNCDGLDNTKGNLVWATAKEQAETRTRCCGRRATSGDRRPRA